MTAQTAMAFSQAPSIAVNVKDIGARGDGSVDDAPAIQQALDNHRGFVIIPPGTYTVGRPLKIASNTRLAAHPQATLKLADGVGQAWDDFLLTNRNPEQGDQNIEITGGIWCGNNINNPRGVKLIDPGRYSGVMLNFRNVRGLRLGDCMLCDSQAYYVRLSRISDFIVENISFHSRSPSNNNDGIHLAGNCHDGIVRHLRGLGRGAPNDDMVAMNADDALERTECQGKECGPIRNIHVYDVQADDCHTFVRLLSVASPIENIDIDNVRGGCNVAMLNLDGARGCRVQVFDANDPAYARGVGLVRNVTVNNVKVYKTAQNTAPLVNLQERLDNMVIRSFHRDHTRDCAPTAPTMLARFLPDQLIRLEGLCGRQAEALLEKSSAKASLQPLFGPDPRSGLHAEIAVQWGQEVILSEGSFERLTAQAGPAGLPK